MATDIAQVELKMEPATALPADDIVNRICEVRLPFREGSTGADSDQPIAALQRQVAQLSCQLADHQRQLRKLWVELAASREQQQTTGSSGRVITVDATDPGKEVLSGWSSASGEVGAQSSPRRRRRWFFTRFARKSRCGASTHTWELAESAWDAALFFGRSDAGMGSVVTLWAVFVLLLNTLVQAMIALIMVLKMGDANIIARTIADLWCVSVRLLLFIA
jgi:hypothetical protein